MAAPGIRSAVATQWRCANVSMPPVSPLSPSGRCRLRLRRAAVAAAASQIDVSVKIVGVSFGERQATIERTPVGAAVACIRQPENPHDADAVECFAMREGSAFSLGFLPRALNTILLSPDSEGCFARVMSVGRNDKGLFGITIAMKREGPGLLVTPSPVRGSNLLQRMDSSQLGRLRTAVVSDDKKHRTRCPYCMRHPADDIRLQWSYCDTEARARVRRVLPVCTGCSSALRISRRRAPTPDGEAPATSSTIVDEIKHIEKVNGLSRSESVAYLSAVRTLHARRLSSSWKVDASLLREMLQEDLRLTGEESEPEPLLPDPLVL